jgi:hypothetical protein
MKQRKDQTEEQRIMRDMGALIISRLPEGASGRFALKRLWEMHPYGYKNFNAYFQSVMRLTPKSVNSCRKITVGEKTF